MFKFVLVIQKLGFCLTVFYCFNKVSSQSEKNRSIPLRFFSFSQIFSRLFHCSVIKVLCRFLSHATAFIYYQNCLRLSRTFLIHDNRKFAEHTFYYIFFADRLICLPVARDSLYIISPGSTIVNNFFYFFHFIILPFDLLIVLPPDLDRQKTAIPTVSHSYSSFSFLNIFDF